MARGKELLTVKQVANAKPGEQDTYLNDGKGLMLRIRPSGKRTWRLRYTVNGARRILDLGDGDLMSLQEARQKAEEARKLVDQGTCPIEHAQAKEEARKEAQEAKRREQASRRTFATALDRWAELELSNRKDGGAESMRALRKDVVPTLGERDLATIKRGDLVDILDGIVARGSRRMANRTLADLKQFLGWCEAREWIDRNPLHGLSKDKIGGTDTERERVLSPDEIKELRDKLPAARFERPTELAIWIMLSTLARVGELAQARWEHIDLEAGTWTIPAGNSKNAKEHTVYLSDFARRQFEDLRELTNWSEWCLPSSHKDEHHVCLKSLTRQIRDRQRTTALSNRTKKATGTLILSGGTWTPHDLRRSGATLMGELGILSEVIERCLNHVEQNRIKRTYQRHELKAERREAWARLGARLDELVNDKERKVVAIVEARG